MTYKDSLFWASISFCLYLHPVRALNSDGKPLPQERAGDCWPPICSLSSKKFNNLKTICQKNNAVSRSRPFLLVGNIMTPLCELLGRGIPCLDRWNLWIFKRTWSTILMKGGRWWQDPKADAFWDVGTKSYLFQPSNTAENDLVGRQSSRQRWNDIQVKAVSKSVSRGLEGGRQKSGKRSGSFTGPLAELISAEPLTWVVELVLEHWRNWSTDGTDVSWMVDWECVWGVGQTTSSANRVAD